MEYEKTSSLSGVQNCLFGTLVENVMKNNVSLFALFAFVWRLGHLRLVVESTIRQYIIVLVPVSISSGK
jgi:hypothetical protein